MPTGPIELSLPSGKTMHAYAARPDDANAPGVVVIHEVWGVDEHIRSVVDRFAAAGFAAIAPDLIGMEVTIPPEAFFQVFGAIRQLPPEERAVPARIDAVLETLPESQRPQAKAIIACAGNAGSPQNMAGVDAAIAWLKQQGAKKVALMGFCMGGAVAFAHAYAGGDADAYSPWYGRLPADPDPTKVKAPIEGHFGGADEGIPAEPIEEAMAALRARGIEAKIYVYDGAPHAFFNDTRGTFDAGAAKLAWERELAFFNKHLR